MSAGQRTFPRRRFDRLVCERVGEELVIFDPDTNRVHGLHPVAARVFEGCDGTRDPQALAANAGCTPAEAADALGQLDAGGLLDTLGPLAAVTGVARREALKRFAKLGAVAGSAPLIVSAFVNTPLAHASTNSTCTACTSSCPTGYSCDPSGYCIPSNCSFITTCTTGSSCFAGVVSGTCQAAACGTSHLCCT
jgi:hypothetical protein